MSNDIRVTDPTGNSIYESFNLQNKPDTTSSAPPVVTTPVEGAPPVPADANDVTGQPESKSIDNVGFVDNQDFFKDTSPLINVETGQLLLFKATDTGVPIMSPEGQLQRDEEGGIPLFIKVDENQQPLMDKDQNITFVETTKDQRSFYINNVIQEQNQPTEAASPTAAAGDPDTQEFQVFQLVNQETQEPLLFDYDEKGQPIFEYDENQQIISKEGGKPALYKADAEGNPILDKEGNYIFLDPNQPQEEIPVAAQKVMELMNTHSAQRVLNGIWMKSFGVSALNWGAKSLVKGVSVGIPFTQKAIGFGVKHAVAKAVGIEVKAAMAISKTGSTTLVKSLLEASKPASEGAVKALTKGGALGKGLQPVIMKEAAKEGGRIAGRVKAVKDGAQAGKAIVKTVGKAVSEQGSKAGAKAVAEVAKKAVVGSGERALQKGVTEGIEAGIKTATKRGGKKIAEKVVTKGTQKAIVKAAEKAAVKASVKTAAKVGGRAAMFIPVAGAVAGGAITAWDTMDAIEKSKNGSTASAALAWTTVGLDVVATATTATGILAPIGWVATGLSIGTSILSDWF